MTIRLNIGAGSDLREDYINVDIHSKEEIEKRYGTKLSDKLQVVNMDIFNLPYEDGTVSEIMCNGFLEHLSFIEEKKFFLEVKRVLKPDGIFQFTVPDFDSLAAQWLAAEDDFKDFYKIGTDEHWFGNYSRTLNNKWGYLTASIFGNQDGAGQFHKNAYTEGKIVSIMRLLNFSFCIEDFYFKDTKVKMFYCKSYKND